MGYNPDEDSLLDLLDMHTTYDGTNLCPYCEHFEGSLYERASAHLFCDPSFFTQCSEYKQARKDMAQALAKQQAKLEDVVPKLYSEFMEHGYAKFFDMDVDFPKICGDDNDYMPAVSSCEKYKRIFIDFNTYLKSTMWKGTRERILERDGYQCVFCGSAKNLQVHHVTYKNIPFEEDDDLMTVCESCHRKLHKYDMAKREGKGRKR